MPTRERNVNQVLALSLSVLVAGTGGGGEEGRED